jgi:hypothetical protein
MSIENPFGAVPNNEVPKSDSEKEKLTLKEQKEQAIASNVVNLYETNFRKSAEKFGPEVLDLLEGSHA